VWFNRQKVKRIGSRKMPWDAKAEGNILRDEMVLRGRVWWRNLVCRSQIMQPMQSLPTVVFGYSTGVILIPVMACIVLAVIAVICLRKAHLRKFGYVFLVLGLISGGVALPSLARDKIIISSQEFAVSTGFWFAPAHKGFLYQDVRLVRLRQVAHTPAWQVEHKDGHAELIECTPLWVKNYQRIMDELQKRGISFRNDIVGY
jgi:hypothetical protein